MCIDSISDELNDDRNLQSFQFLEPKWVSYAFGGRSVSEKWTSSLADRIHRLACATSAYGGGKVEVGVKIKWGDNTGPQGKIGTSVEYIDKRGNGFQGRFERDLTNKTSEFDLNGVKNFGQEKK